MNKLIPLRHMTGDAVTPRHLNALVDVINAQRVVINKLAAALESTIEDVDSINVRIADLLRRLDQLINDLVITQVGFVPRERP